MHHFVLAKLASSNLRVKGITQSIGSIIGWITKGEEVDV